MANGRITNKEIYGMQAEVKEEISGCRERLSAIESKQDDMAGAIQTLFKTVGNHTEKIGIIRGKIMVWGLIGGGCISIVVFVLARLILGG